MVYSSECKNPEIQQILTANPDFPLSLLKKLAGETALYGMSSILGRFLNYLLVPIYTRTLSVEDNGVINEFYAYTAFLIVVYSYRMESAFFRFGTAVEDRERAYTSAMASLIVTSTLFSAGAWLLAQPLSNILEYSAHPEYIKYLSLVLAFDALCELPFARLRLEQRPWKFVGAKLVNIGLNISLTLFWLVFCPWAAGQGWSWVHEVWSEEIGVGYVFIANMVASAATFFLLLPQMRLLPSFMDSKLLRSMLKYAWPLIIVQFAGIINLAADRTMLKWLLPGTVSENLSAVGIYGNNYKLAALITIFTQAYRYAAEPFFFRNAVNPDAPEIQAKAAKWFTLAAVTGMLGVLLFLDLIKYFLGPDYFSGLHVVPVLLLSNVLLGMYYNFSVWYRLRDKTLIGAAVSLTAAGLTLGLNFALIPYFGYTGAAWTALATNLFLCVATLILGRRYYKVPYQLGRMAGYIALAFVLYGAERLFSGISLEWADWVMRVLLMSVFILVVFKIEFKNR